MNIDDLKCFEAVYREGSIHKAAKHLFITPQGLGKNIRNLENELGTLLFLRSKKGVEPTQSSHFLYQRTGKIMEMMEEVIGGIKQLEEGQRRLRIGCACGVFNVLSLPALLDFTACHSDIQITWGEYPNNEVWQQLESNRLEYGFVVGDAHVSGFERRLLAKKKVLLLVYPGHPLYDARQVTLDELSGEKMIVMNEHFHIYHDFTGACQARGFMPDIVAKTADGKLLNRLCRQRVGLAVIPEFMLEDTDLGEMRAVPFYEKLSWDVYGVYKKENSQLYTICLMNDYLSKA
ncbi:MAG: LysR family transcriptional regulator [Clostridiales bacterium]|nr:LysR family transcriptional regulator [Clostridiales bacterium]